jgi:hypothetical protein
VTAQPWRNIRATTAKGHDARRQGEEKEWEIRTFESEGDGPMRDESNHQHSWNR